MTRSQTLDEMSKLLSNLTQQVSGIGALTSAVNKLVDRQELHDQKLNNILETVTKSEESIQAVRTELTEYKTETNERISKLEKDVTVNRDHDERIRTLEKELKTLRNEAKINKLLSEYHNKKYNLIINGVPEKDRFNDYGLAVWESNIDTTDAVRDFFADVLKVDIPRRWNFVNVHRLGLPNKKGPRGIIVRFSDMRHKETVMANLFRLKHHNQITGGSRIYVHEQLPTRMAKQRKILIAKFKEARSNKKKTRWAIDKATADYVLYVNKIKVDSGYVTSDDESDDDTY